MDPGLASLKSAARSAVVMPAVFAFTDKVIGDLQTALFAAFGSFAMLVLVDFTGPARSSGICEGGKRQVVELSLCHDDVRNVRRDRRQG